MIDFRQTVRIPDQVLSREIDGETVLLDLQSENYFGLDEVGNRIWQLIKAHGDLQTVFDTMLEEYDVESELLKKDMDKLLGRLIEDGLVILAPTEPDGKTP